jgi:hypothetical protein
VLRNLKDAAQAVLLLNGAAGDAQPEHACRLYCCSTHSKLPV